MYCFWMTLLLFSNLPSLLNGLTCHSGEEIINRFSKAASGQNEECSTTETHCLRMESVGMQFMFQVNLTKMMCATREFCENASCAELSRRIFASDEDESSTEDIDIASLLFELKSCEVICCQEDQCNHRSIVEVRHTALQEREASMRLQTLNDSVPATTSLIEENHEDTTEAVVSKIDNPPVESASIAFASSLLTNVLSFLLLIFSFLLQV